MHFRMRLEFHLFTIFTMKELKSEEFDQDIKKSESICLLFKRTVQLAGVRLVPEAADRFQNVDNFAFEYPVEETDIDALVERFTTYYYIPNS
jgi:hypothetical protein